MTSVMVVLAGEPILRVRVRLLFATRVGRIIYNSNMDNLFKIISTRRSIRRFDSERNVDLETLKNMVKLGSLAPSRMNRQPWQFIIINDKETRGEIFKNILWGIKNPVNKNFADINYAPNSYVAILTDERIAKTGYEYETGACAENMMVYAWGLGIGSVWIHSINRENIVRLLKIPKEIKLDSVLALGYPNHVSKIIDTLPESREELNKIFTEISLDEDEAKKILDVVEEYR